ncbi:MAG: ATP-binding cassette domain-containing protein, partial [Candidatus Bathyarchaeia archaeon]
LMLSTLTRPTSGHAIIAGYDVVREAHKVREIIGYSAQEAGVDRNATGRENLTLYGHYHHLDRRTIRQRVDELLELVGLLDVADRLVNTYSSGMRKRLEIATALINKPRLLFLDEPTLGLDIQTRVHIWEYIRKLNNDGTTILLTTHYLEEADKLCHRVAIIDYGQIVALGTPNGLKEQVQGETVSLIFPLQEPEKLKESLNKAVKILSSQSFIKNIQPTGDCLNIYVNEGGSAIPRILRLLEGVGLTIESVSLSQPSLDDVFIKYTGRRMREERK